MKMLENMGIPSFLLKLRKLVDDPETRKNIYWNKDGKSFIIDGPSEFSQNVLPLYYKHKNLSSFVRQLNLYGFHKVSGQEEALRTASDMMQFSHKNFIEKDELQLIHIKKKQAISRVSNLNESRELVNIQSEIESIKDRNQKLESKVDRMESQNKVLYDGYIHMRNKLEQQQSISEKLLKFLMQILQGNSSNKRKRSPYSVAHSSLSDTASKNAAFQRIAPRAIEGPTLHDVGYIEDGAHNSYVNSVIPESDIDSKAIITTISEPKEMENPTEWIVNDEDDILEDTGDHLTPNVVFQNNHISRSPGGNVLDNDKVEALSVNEFVDQFLAPLSPSSSTTPNLSEVRNNLSISSGDSSSTIGPNIGSKSNVKHILVGKKPDGKATTVRLNKFPATSHYDQQSRDNEVAIQPYQGYINEDKVLGSVSSMPLVPNFSFDKVDNSSDLMSYLNIQPDQMNSRSTTVEELMSAREIKFENDLQSLMSISLDDYSDLKLLPPKHTGKELSLYMPSVVDLLSDSEDNKKQKKLPKLDLELAQSSQDNNYGLETPKVSYEEWGD